MRDCSPDIVGFCEANGWHDDNYQVLRYMQAATGLHNSFFCQANTAYHLVFLSLFSLFNTRCERVGLWHGSAVARYYSPDIGEVTIVLVHLDPRSEDERFKEVRLILSHFGLEKNLIMMGDFNSLSPADCYTQDIFLSLQRKSIRKFGDAALRYDVINSILDAGLHDVFDIKGRYPVSSVPTSLREDPTHIVPLRLDYIFVSPGLASYIKEVFFYTAGESLEASDHFPLVVDFAFS